MSLLKKENWIVCLILNLITQGFFTFILAYFLGIYEKEAWYKKWQYWVFGSLCLIFPVFIMLLVFTVQITVKVASKLDVPGKEIYDNPYTWVICLIAPIVGWIVLFVIVLYLELFTIVSLYKGNGEKYIG